jgi:hypothetical protein
MFRQFSATQGYCQNANLAEFEITTGYLGSEISKLIFNRDPWFWASRTFLKRSEV